MYKENHMIVKEKSSSKFVQKYEHIKDGLLFCTRCKEYKDESHFSKRSDLEFRNYKDYDCKECVSLLRQEAYTRMRTNKLKSLNTLEGYLKTVLQHARCRKHEFNITTEDLLEIYHKQKGLCAYTNQEMTYILGKGKINTNISLDRIDSNIGYIKENIQLTIRIINTMKHDSTEEDFINLCKLVAINN